MQSRANAEPVVNFEITLLRKANAQPLTKHIYLNQTGHVVSDGSACVMTSGVAGRFCFTRIGDFAELLGQLAPDFALALGVLRDDLPNQVEIVTKRRLNGGMTPGVVARTRDFFMFRDSTPALALV